MLDRLTRAIPRLKIPKDRAAARDKSIIRLRVLGRSLIVTITEFPVSIAVTRTRVPIGSVACAAVNAFSS